MHTRRKNTVLAAAVDQAIGLAAQQNSNVAAHFLEDRGAAFPLICRVLMEPKSRRAPVVDLQPASS